LGKQVIPDSKELEDSDDPEDPLNEEKQSPVPNLICRYPDRVLFLVSNHCAMYCRYCTRKRKVGRSAAVTYDSIKEGIKYIADTKAIREVVMSGGDPLMLEDEELREILYKLRLISHVEILRIHTRIPCAMPERINEDLTEMLRTFHPLYINIQFNHPDEITPESREACLMLADAGIPLGSQTVLLRGVNYKSEIMIRLMRELLKIRIKPYYLHHPDIVKGTGHFRVSIIEGLNILKDLYGGISGIGIPHYMLDLPGGGGKIPLI